MNTRLPATLIAPTCAGCKCYHLYDNGQGGQAHICRAHPPTVLGGVIAQNTPNGPQPGFIGNTIWPTINPNSDWCNEYVTKLTLS